ncbi:putative uncharacterized protein [Prevotella sp. CAG:1092]|nr:putative uncharacterized protein [Prevotella sp. CAG:1092]
MSQYAYRLHACSQSVAMGTDIYTIGKSANYQRVGACYLQLFGKLLDDILAVGSSMASAYDTDYSFGVEVGIAHIIKHHRSIRTFSQALRIEWGTYGKRFDTIIQIPLQFALSPFPVALSILESFHQAWRSFRYQLLDVATCLDNLRSRASLRIQFV